MSLFQCQYLTSLSEIILKKKMSMLSFVLSEFMSQSLPLKKNNLLEFTVPVIALQQTVGETRLLISTNMFEVWVLEFLYSYVQVPNL